MTLFIAGGYSCGNPGDEAILKSTLYRLKEIFPQAHFLIWSDSMDFDPRFDRDISYEMFYWKPLSWRRSGTLWSRIATKLYMDLYPFSKYLLVRRAYFDSRAMKAVRSADKVVFVGGGYLSSDFCLPEASYISALARQLKKPIYLLGQTLGPFHRKHQRMADDLFREADEIVLRDMDSDMEVPGFKEKVWHGTDDAVAFEPRLLPEDRDAVSRYFESGPERIFYLGLNLRNWKDARRFYPQIAQALESFAKTFIVGRLKIIFVPMEISRFCDDREEGRLFAKHLSPAADYVCVNEPLSVEQTHYLISRLDLLIGMRLHTLVFALAGGVPTIGLYQGAYYFRKISGLFESFHMEKELLSLDRLEDLGSLIRANARDAKSVHDLLVESKARIVENQRTLLGRVLDPERNTA